MFVFQPVTGTHKARKMPESKDNRKSSGCKQTILISLFLCFNLSYFINGSLEFITIDTKKEEILNTLKHKVFVSGAK